MQIVHVVRQFMPSVGGLENVVAELAQAQVGRGDDVRVITLNRLFNSGSVARLARDETWRGIKIERIPFIGSQRYPIAPAVLARIAGADLVHVHGVDFFADYLAWTKPLHKRTLLLSTHGGFFHTKFAARLKRLYFATVTRASLTWFAGVAAVSRSDFELFSGIRKHGMVCIENGVDIAKYRDAASRSPCKRMIFIGRLARNKRIDRLLHFLQAVRAIDPDWSLVVAGRAWEVDVEALRKQAARLGQEREVEFLENPSDCDLRDQVERCSVVVSASEYEGFGLSAVEGISAGMLPVLSGIPSFQAIIDGVGAGTIVDFDRPDLAARKFLDCWTDHRARYEENRAYFVKAAERFGWDASFDRYGALYDAVRGTDCRDLLDVPIRVCTNDKAVDLLDSKFEAARPTIVTFANAHALNVATVNRRFQSILRSCIVLNDGVGADIASRILYGAPFPANLNGTDFTPHYLRKTRHRLRIYLLGAKGNVAERAANALRQLVPQHEVVGWHSGYFGRREGAGIIQEIRDLNADVVLVAMGNPRQELWLHENLVMTGCRLGIAVGALFDFLAGEVPRANALFRRARLEWLYRLGREPRRLWRRYILGNPAFLLRVLGQWSTGSRVAG